jgi:hypothetical protein
MLKPPDSESPEDEEPPELGEINVMLESAIAGA